MLRPLCGDVVWLSAAALQQQRGRPMTDVFRPLYGDFPPPLGRLSAPFRATWPSEPMGFQKVTRGVCPILLYRSSSRLPPSAVGKRLGHQDEGKEGSSSPRASRERRSASLRGVVGRPGSSKENFSGRSRRREPEDERSEDDRRSAAAKRQDPTSSRDAHRHRHIPTRRLASSRGPTPWCGPVWREPRAVLSGPRCVAVADGTTARTPKGSR